MDGERRMRESSSKWWWEEMGEREHGNDTFMIFLNFFPAVEIDAVLDRCCEFGSRHSTSSHSCTNFFFNISSEIPKNLAKLCRFNIEFCCEKDRRTKHCIDGVNWAKTESTCNGHNHKNSEMFKVIWDSAIIPRILSMTLEISSFSFAAALVKLVSKLLHRAENAISQLGTQSMIKQETNVVKISRNILTMKR